MICVRTTIEDHVQRSIAHGTAPVDCLVMDSKLRLNHYAGSVVSFYYVDNLTSLPTAAR